MADAFVWRGPYPNARESDVSMIDHDPFFTAAALSA
jgi:hypothetical protein